MIFITILIITNFIFPQLNAKLIAKDFEKPLYVTNYPNEIDKLIILEQNGIIKIINQSKPYLDISDRVHQPLYPADEMGMLGIAFDPNFLENRTFYVHYNDNDNNTIISKFKDINNFGIPDSEQKILKLKQPYPNHNGGSIEFGPDGYLYIGLGDGGSAGDPENRAQDCTNLFGTILRIDVSVENGYKIPIDNPFINSHCLDEIWSYGLRNPWRFTFDKKTGDMFIGDVGQNNWEEINFESKDSNGGLNFGWKILEGTHCYPNDNNKCDKDGMIPPLFEYPNDANYLKTIIGFKQSKSTGCSVTGGYIYRGNNFPELYGRYFFGDYCTGKVWSIDKRKKNFDFVDHTQELLQNMNKKQFYLSSFGQDDNGELYLIDYNGELYSITNR